MLLDLMLQFDEVEDLDVWLHTLSSKDRAMALSLIEIITMEANEEFLGDCKQAKTILDKIMRNNRGSKTNE